MTEPKKQKAALYFEARMGDFVAAVFLLMFIFGILTFMVYFILGFFVEDLRDPKLALGLLTFAASGATGFGATWRFMVVAARNGLADENRPPPDPPAGGHSSDEDRFREENGYWPMQDNRGDERWGPLR